MVCGIVSISKRTFQIAVDESYKLRIIVVQRKEGHLKMEREALQQKQMMIEICES